MLLAPPSRRTSRFSTCSPTTLATTTERTASVLTAVRRSPHCLWCTRVLPPPHHLSSLASGLSRRRPSSRAMTVLVGAVMLGRVTNCRLPTDSLDTESPQAWRHERPLCVCMWCKSRKRVCSVRSQDEDKCSVVECEYLEEVWLCVGIDGSTEKRQWQCMAAWVRRQSGARCVVCCGCKRIEAKVDSTRTSPVVTHPSTTRA